MEALKRAEKVKLKDKFKREFDHANTRLAVTALPLRRHEIQLEQLDSFVDAGLKLAEICQQEHAQESPLNILFWLRKRLLLETRKPCRNFHYRAKCRQEIDRIHTKLHCICNTYGSGNAVPLL